MEEIKVIKSTIFEERLRNGLFLRMGGVSRGKFSSLNFSFNTGDDEKNVSKNWAIAGEFTGWREMPHLANQIHSDKVIICSHSAKPVRDGDSLIIFKRNEYAGITTADCLPVAIFDQVRNVAAIIHCGWKGTYKKIVSKTLYLLKDRFGCSFQNLLVSLFPCIGECCYEIKEDVAEKFENSYLLKRDGKVYLNLKNANKGELIEAGIMLNHIEAIGLCTVCNPEILYSYRRDGENTGRHLTFIGLK